MIEKDDPPTPGHHPRTTFVCRTDLTNTTTQLRVHVATTSRFGACSYSVLTGPRSLGDHGQTLVSGISQYLNRKEGRLRLQRTGPFVPPLAVASHFDLLVSQQGRELLAGVEGVLDFVPVIRNRIVRVENFEDLLANAGDLPGEPEDFLLSSPHDESTSREIGDIYEVVLAREAKVVRQGGRGGESYFEFEVAPQGRNAIFRSNSPSGLGKVVVAKSLLEELPDEAMRWLATVPVW